VNRPFPHTQFPAKLRSALRCPGWRFSLGRRGSRGNFGAAVFLTDPKLFKDRGQIETERIKLLQEIEHHSRAGPGQAREPRAAAIGHAIALIDDEICGE
jgi:hypothetical protein